MPCGQDSTATMIASLYVHDSHTESIDCTAHKQVDVLYYRTNNASSIGATKQRKLSVRIYPCSTYPVRHRCQNLSQGPTSSPRSRSSNVANDREAIGTVEFAEHARRPNAFAACASMLLIVNRGMVDLCFRQSEYYRHVARNAMFVILCFRGNYFNIEF